MTDLLGLLADPLAYPFMVRGMAAAIMVGVVCALVGSYVILRRMAFFGDALAHAVLPGIALGYLVSGGVRTQIMWWGLGTGVFTALGIGALGQRARIKEDTAIGIIFSSMFALGIAIISSMRSYAVDLNHFMFGDVLGVSGTDLWLVGGLGALIIVCIVALYKEFLVISFDPILAQTLRLPVGLLNNMLLVLIALAIVASLQTVGVALMVAMLVTPAATAYLLARRLPTMMVLAALFGALSGVVGLYVSYYVGIASGSAIVLVCTGLFVLALLFAPRKGLVRGWLRNARGGQV